MIQKFKSKTKIYKCKIMISMNLKGFLHRKLTFDMLLSIKNVLYLRV